MRREAFPFLFLYGMLRSVSSVDFVHMYVLTQQSEQLLLQMMK